MELYNEEEFQEYIIRNYECVIENQSAEINIETAGTCEICKRDVFLKVHSRAYNFAYSRVDGLPRFVTYLIECPHCRRVSFLKTVQFEEIDIIKDEDGEDEHVKVYKSYKLFRLPTIEESFANKDIPEVYTSLKNTISEASFCLSHGRNIASAILFRRGLQILTKDILGATGKTLYLQLEWLKSNKNKLGIDLNETFHVNAKIIKEIGNQGAHPEEDITLQNFTKEDADGLHDLFISIIHETFVKPSKMKMLQDDLKKSRKLKY